MVFGGPSVDFTRSSIYLMTRIDTGPKDDVQKTTSVQIRRYNYLTKKDTVLFSDDATSKFTFLVQAPAQLPAAWDPASSRFYFFAKQRTSAKGTLFYVDFSAWKDGDTVKTLADAVVLYADKSDCFDK